MIKLVKWLAYSLKEAVDRLSLQTKIETFLDGGGRVFLCPACLEKNFGLDWRQPGIPIEGVEPFNPSMLPFLYTDGSISW